MRSRGQIEKDNRRLEESRFRSEIEKMINKVYAENSKTALDVIEGLMAKYNTLNDRARAAFVTSVEDTLKSRQIIAKQHANVLQKEAEMRNLQSSGSEIDLNRLVPEMKNRMGVDEDRWQAYYDQYGPQYNDTDTLQRKIDLIKNDSSPTLHTMPLRRNGAISAAWPFSPIPSWSTSYRKLLYEANKQTSADLANNSHELNSLIQNGRIIPKPTIDKIADSACRGGEGLAIKGLSAFNSLISAAGKGIYSKSDPNNSSYLRKYHDLRNQLFSNLLWNVNPGQNKNSKILERCKKILEESQNDPSLNGTGLMDEASFRELSTLISDEIAKNDKDNEAKIQEFNKNINNLNKQALESAKSQTDDSDAMFKWRILQAALIISPFMGLSIMGPITHIFSGVFMNAGGLGQGIASLATAEYTGPFGQICELLHLDEAIKWLLCDMPVLSNVVSIADSAISNNLVQGLLGGVVMPLANSPLVPIAIASVFSLFRANAEIDYHKKYGDAFKGHEEAMREELDKIYKEAAEDPEKYDMRQFIDKKFNIMRDFYFKASLAEYAADKFREIKDANGGKEFFAEIMGDRFMKALKDYKSNKQDGKDHSVFDKDGNISNKELMNFLADSSDSSFYDKILLFSALEKQGQEENKGVEDVLENFQKIQYNSGAKSIIEAAKKLREEEYILQLANHCGIDSSKVPEIKVNNLEKNEIYTPREIAESQDRRTKALKKVEEEIKKAEVEFFKNNSYDTEMMQQKLTPMSIAVPKSSLSLNTAAVRNH